MKYKLNYRISENGPNKIETLRGKFEAREVTQLLHFIYLLIYGLLLTLSCYPKV